MILISRCCTGSKCRYRHVGFFRKFVAKVAEFEDFIALCPEQMGGLPTPREGCGIIEGRAIGRKTGKDYTAPYLKGARETLEICDSLNIKTAYLLKGSPSCGKGYGLTARLLEKHGIKVIPV